MLIISSYIYFFFFNDTATTEIYTLSLHDALPIFHGQSALAHLQRGDYRRCLHAARKGLKAVCKARPNSFSTLTGTARSEEHTSELQSQSNLVCRLLLEKKKTKTNTTNT